MTHVHSQGVESPEPSPSPQPRHVQGQQEPTREFEMTPVGRFRYEAWQHVAPMFDGRLPSASSFEAVQCQDLSRKGVSFFTEHLPKAEMLVVALGNPPELRFFTARVAGSPAATRYGKAGYQVECEFVSKLAEVYQWGEEEERIIGAPSMGDEAQTSGHKQFIFQTG